MKAFPRKDAVEIDDKGRCLPQLGMDLRDYFAAKAMQGLMQWIADMEFNDGENTPIAIAKASYEYADAMMEERNAQWKRV